MPAADIAATQAQVLALLGKDERLQVLIHRIGVWHPQLANEGGKCRRNFELHRVP
ncbi:MAG: hypothetical protein MOB07_12000 [Acidobacteria bacterium]|nr:hypothetical protein [Acidobacteriota bacterium]